MPPALLKLPPLLLLLRLEQCVSHLQEQQGQQRLRLLDPLPH
jgi:hypothetical protein